MLCPHIFRKKLVTTMRITIAIMALIMPLTCFSAFINGQKLQEWVNSNSRVDAGTATSKDYESVYQFAGYVSGVVDTLNGSNFCLSKGVTTGQLMDIVGKFATDHPEIRHLNATPLVVVALERAFPCEKH